jgi:ABC-type transport system substrate-binding protein
MKRTAALRALAASLALTATVAACAAPPDAGQGGSTAGAINVFMYQKPAGIFGPIAPASGPDQQVLSLIYEPLLAASPAGKLVPALAEGEPKVSADARTVTFRIKPGLTWSDGAPITSHDVLFSYTRAADTRAARV